MNKIVLFFIIISFIGCASSSKVAKLESDLEYLKTNFAIFKTETYNQVQSILFEKEINSFRYKNNKNVELIKANLYDGKDIWGDDCEWWCDKFFVFPAFKDKPNTYKIVNISVGTVFYLKVENEKVKLTKL